MKGRLPLLLLAVGLPLAACNEIPCPIGAIMRTIVPELTMLDSLRSLDCLESVAGQSRASFTGLFQFDFFEVSHDALIQTTRR